MANVYMGSNSRSRGLNYATAYTKLSKPKYIGNAIADTYLGNPTALNNFNRNSGITNVANNATSAKKTSTKPKQTTAPVASTGRSGAGSVGGGAVTGGAVSRTSQQETERQRLEAERKALQQRQKEIEQFLKQSSDGFYKEQKAMLEQSLQDRLTQLEKAYADAIATGQLSIQEANELFEQDRDAIYEEAYRSSQSVALQAEQRGIGNSQQMLAMQNDVNNRTNTIIQSVRDERNKRVQQLQDRINQITKEKDLDTTNLQRSFDTSLRQARGQADQMFAQGMAQFKISDYQMDKSHMLDLQKMSKQFEYDLDKMAKQHGYQIDLQNRSHAQAMARAKQQATQRMQQAQDEYRIAMERELAKYTKGTPEYEIRQRQMQAEMDNYLTKAYYDNVNSALGSIMQENPTGQAAIDYSKDPTGVVRNYASYLDLWGGATQNNGGNNQSRSTGFLQRFYNPSNPSGIMSGIGLR